MVFPLLLLLLSLFIPGPFCLSIRQWSRPACVTVSSFRGLGSRLLCSSCVLWTFHLCFGISGPGVSQSHPRACPFSCLHFLDIFNLSSRESFILGFLAFHPFHFEARIKQEQEKDTVMLVVFFPPYKCYYHVHAFRRRIPPSPFATDLVNSHPSTLKSPKLPSIPVIIMPAPAPKKKRTQLRPSPPDPMRPNAFQCFRDAHLKKIQFTLEDIKSPIAETMQRRAAIVGMCSNRSCCVVDGLTGRRKNKGEKQQKKATAASV